MTEDEDCGTVMGIGVFLDGARTGFESFLEWVENLHSLTEEVPPHTLADLYEEFEEILREQREMLRVHEEDEHAGW